MVAIVYSSKMVLDGLCTSYCFVLGGARLLSGIITRFTFFGQSRIRTINAWRPLAPKILSVRPPFVVVVVVILLSSMFSDDHHRRLGFRHSVVVFASS